MTRPKCAFQIKHQSKAQVFEPDVEYCPKTGFIELSPEEVESLKLKNIDGLEQIQAAKVMGVSQSTFQRVLTSAHKKISQAIIDSKAIKLIR